MRETYDPLEQDQPRHGTRPRTLLMRICSPFLRVVVFGSLFVLLLMWSALQSLKFRLRG